MEIRMMLPEQAEALLQDFNLSVPQDVDLTLGAFHKNQLVGCCSLNGDMLQGLAVARGHQGEGITRTLVTELLKQAARRGIHQLCVITKPEIAEALLGIGFRLVAQAPPYAALLEFGAGGIADYTSQLRQAAQGMPFPRAAVVLNANPFTLGHRHLVERACAENGWVFALVVQEDLSEFPFAARLDLVRQGTRDLPNLSAIPGGRYVVSSLTFPSYFTKRQDLAAAEGALDAALFAEAIAPALQAKKRYVGTEPASPVTDAYNQALKERLPRDGVQLLELPRLEIGGLPVSASTVRDRFHAADWEGLKPLVPETTYAYLWRLAHGDA